MDMLEKLNPNTTKNVHNAKEKTPLNSKVLKGLQQQCESTKAQQTFRFTKEQVQWISYIIDTHVDDYQVIMFDYLAPNSQAIF